MPSLPLPLSPLTVDAVVADAVGLAARDETVLDPNQEWELRCWSLQNDLDQIQDRARATGDDPSSLVTGLIRLAARALLWVETLEGHRPAETAAAGPAGTDPAGDPQR